MTRHRSISILSATLVALLTPHALADDITISVRDLATGKPLPNVAVKVDPISGDAVEATTGDDGTAKLAYPQGAADGVEVSVAADGYVPLMYYWFKGPKSDPRPDHYNFQLEHGTTIGGLVVDEHDRPIPDATVELHVSKKFPEPGLHLNISYRGVKTGPDGKWSYNGMPATFDSMELGAYERHHLGQYAYYPMDEVKDVAALRAAIFKTVLHTGAPLTVTVLDAHDKPLPDAKIGYGEDRIASNIVPAANVDAAGKVELGAPPDMPIVLTATAKGFAPQQQRVTLSREGTALTFHLAPAVPLTGKVVDSAGKPIDNAWICIDTWRGTRPFDARVFTKPDGTFSWPDAPADDVFVDVLKPGFADQRRVRMKVGDPNLVKLTSPTRFEASVLDADTGKPVDIFHVILGIDFKNGSGVSWDRDSHEEGTTKNGKIDITFSYPYPVRIMRVEADGYLPADSDPIPMDGQTHRFTYRLVHGKPLAGTVTTPAGKPVSDAQAILVTGAGGVQVQNGKVPDWEARSAPMTKTSADGRFSFPPQKDPYALLILANDGYAQVTQQQLEKSNAITLTPWARIDGQVRIGTRPGANQKIHASFFYGNRIDNRSDPLSRLFCDGATTADASGHFELTRVYAGDVLVSREVAIGPNQTSYAQSEKISVKPGETLHVTIGGHGRPLVGRLAIPPDVKAAGFVVGMSQLITHIEPVKWSPPPEVATMSPEQRSAWYTAWQKSDEGKRITKAMEEVNAKRKYFPVVIDPNGQFRIDEVPAGLYDLSVSLLSLPASPNACSISGDEVASGRMPVTVPPIPGGVSDDPLDVGALALKPVPHIAVGQLAPDFTTKTLDGRELKLSDFRGKYVLLDFWATWCGPCVEETPNLKDTWTAAGANPRFAMISLSLDNDPKAPAAFVKTKDLPWHQAFLGEWNSDPVTKSYGIHSIPSIWLIDPTGHVLAKDLRGDAIAQTVTTTLANAK